jgi:hypothetical protein
MVWSRQVFVKLTRLFGPKVEAPRWIVQLIEGHDSITATTLTLVSEISGLFFISQRRFQGEPQTMQVIRAGTRSGIQTGRTRVIRSPFSDPALATQLSVPKGKP